MPMVAFAANRSDKMICYGLGKYNKCKKGEEKIQGVDHIARTHIFPLPVLGGGHRLRAKAPATVKAPAKVRHKTQLPKLPIQGTLHTPRPIGEAMAIRPMCLTDRASPPAKNASPPAKRWRLANASPQHQSTKRSTANSPVGKIEKRNVVPGSCPARLEGRATGHLPRLAAVHDHDEQEVRDLIARFETSVRLEQKHFDRVLSTGVTKDIREHVEQRERAVQLVPGVELFSSSKKRSESEDSEGGGGGGDDDAGSRTIEDHDCACCGACPRKPLDVDYGRGEVPHNCWCETPLMDLGNGEWLFDISEEDIRASLGRLMQHPEHYGIATPLTMGDLSNPQKRIVIYYGKVLHTWILQY